MLRHDCSAGRTFNVFGRRCFFLPSFPRTCCSRLTNSPFTALTLTGSLISSTREFASSTKQCVIWFPSRHSAIRWPPNICCQMRPRISGGSSRSLHLSDDEMALGFPSSGEMDSLRVRGGKNFTGVFWYWMYLHMILCDRHAVNLSIHASPVCSQHVLTISIMVHIFSSH